MPARKKKAAKKKGPPRKRRERNDLTDGPMQDLGGAPGLDWEGGLEADFLRALETHYGGVTTLCREDQWPSHSKVFARRDNNPRFRALLEAAIEKQQAHIITSSYETLAALGADDTKDIDPVRLAWAEKTHKAAGPMAKMIAPKKFGDRLAVDVNDGGLREKLRKAEERAKRRGK